MSTVSSLPAPSLIPSLSQERHFKILDTLFEPSQDLHTLLAPVLANQTFSLYNSLIDAVGGRMSALSAANSPSDRAILYGILGSHPRLGRTPNVAPEHMSELSKKEQANLNAGAEEQAERLKVLNGEYEEKFPGLRFVYVYASHYSVVWMSLDSLPCQVTPLSAFETGREDAGVPTVLYVQVTSLANLLFLYYRTFVNGRSRDVIMQEMRQRIDRGDVDREVKEIIQVLFPEAHTYFVQYFNADANMPSHHRPCVI